MSTLSQEEVEVPRTRTRDATEALVLEAFDTLFNKRDYSKAAEFWSEDYIQHSAHIAQGRDGLFNLVRSAPDTLRYENQLIVAQGDYVMLHGRFSGRGEEPAWIAGDIVRMENSQLAEHWDVIQNEATKEESKSGMPMFGTSFAQPHAQSATQSLTIDEARRITAPLYDALNQPATKDVAALLAEAANPDYRSYHTNDDYLTRDQLVDVFKSIGAAVPDLNWKVEDIHTFEDKIVVRGRAMGTPTGELFGARPTGKSFSTMAIDVFTVREGKLASAYHIENWMTALQQIRE